MVQRTGWRLPKAARVAAWLAAVGLAIGLGVACVELRGSLGDDCLKNTDCLSATLLPRSIAAASPPLFTPPGVPEAGADATADGTSPGDDSSSTNDAAEAVDGTGTDAPVDDVAVPPADAPADGLDEAAARRARRRIPGRCGGRRPRRRGRIGLRRVIDTL